MSGNMCDFISWIEAPSAHGGKQVWFLTHADIYESDKGARLRKWSGSPDDYTGHGAIRYFFGLERDQGRDRECTDFSTPDNFPPQIVAAIKAGEMRGMGVAPALLTAAARAEYDRVEDAALAEYKRVKAAARAEYDRVKAAARAEYDRVEDAARAEYDRVKAAARAEYDRVEDAARAEYDRVEDAALAEYERVVAPALAEYKRVKAPAKAEYERVEDMAFWALFAVSANRSEAWSEYQAGEEAEKEAP